MSRTCDVAFRIILVLVTVVRQIDVIVLVDSVTVTGKSRCRRIISIARDSLGTIDARSFLGPIDKLVFEIESFDSFRVAIWAVKREYRLHNYNEAS